MMLQTLQYLLLLIALTTARTNSDLPEELAIATHKDYPWRLPNTTYPLRYHLHLTTQVHREIFEYSGNCTIEILVQQSTDEIVLHAKDLEIESVSLRDLTTHTAQENVEYLRHKIKELLIIKSKGATFVRDQRLLLTVLYTGVINAEVFGFHKMSYEDANNKTVFGASTQFEPTFARTALPCYDEPGLKSNFTVRVTHGSNFTAISNMPQVSVTFDSTHNMTTTTFMESPPMSTYLLAFIICNYVSISAISDDGIVHRVFMPPDSEKDGIVALKNAMRALKVFADYFEVPYALPKIDHIEVRESLGLAMENWGLITYTDNALLYSTGPSSVQIRYLQEYTRNHELAHQWFGNLATPAWWNYLWLSEGFASYYSFVLTELVNIDEKFNAMDSFNAVQCQPALSTREITPVTIDVETPTEIMLGFGFGMYAKAPCLIQMFDHTFGQEIFRKGVSNYLKAHVYSAVNEDDMFDALQSTSFDYHLKLNQNWNYSVHEIMKSWTRSGAHPFVTIIRNYEDNSIKIRQRADRNVTGELWWIPLSFATASQPNFESTKADFFMPPIAELTIDLSNFNITLKNEDWLIVNRQGKGFYDVLYDAENLRRITAAFLHDHKTIHRLNRVHILRSIMKSWLNHENVDLSTVLDLLKYLNREEDAFVWASAVDLLDIIGEYLDGSTLEAIWKNFVRNLIAPTYEQYMKKSVLNLSVTELGLKEELEDLACEVDLPSCLFVKKSQVLNIIKGKLLKNQTIPDYSQNDFCLAAQVLNDEEFDQVMQFYMTDNDFYIWSELSCTKSSTQYKKLLQEALNFNADQGLKRKEKLKFLNSLLYSKYTKDKEITWLVWDKYIQKVFNSSATDILSFCHAVLLQKLDNDDINSNKLTEVIDVCKQRQPELETELIKLFKMKLEKDEDELRRLQHKKFFHKQINTAEIYKWLELENE